MELTRPSIAVRLRWIGPHDGRAAGTVVAMLRRSVRGFQHFALLLARIAIGVVLVARGWHRWMDAGIGEQIRILTEAQLPAPELLAWLVTVFELAGGVLLVFGLGTPIVGLGMLVLNAGIALLRKSDALLLHEGGFEHVLVLAAAGLLFAAFGSGKLGADALFFAPKEKPMPVDEPMPPARPTESTVFSQESHS